MEYSEPKQIAGSKFYSQVIWDEKNKKGYIGILTKNDDGTFKKTSDDFMKDAMAMMNGKKRRRMD